MNDLISCMNQITLEQSLAKFAVQTSIIDMDMKDFMIQEQYASSDVYQEGLLEKISDLGVKSYDFNRVTASIFHIGLSIIGAGFGAITKKTAVQLCGLMTLVNVIAGIGQRMIATKYKEIVVLKELLPKIERLFDLITEKQSKSDDEEKQYKLLGTKMNKFREYVSNIAYDLNFAVAHKRVDDSMASTFKTFEKACIRFLDNTGSEGLIGRIRDEETGKKHFASKKARIEQNIKQLQPFVEALHTFLKDIKSPLVEIAKENDIDVKEIEDKVKAAAA